MPPQPIARSPEQPLYLDPEVHRRRWLVLSAMCLPLVLVVMSVAGLNVALPSIQRQMDASASSLLWTVDAYALVFAGLLLSAGALGDRFGRKGALLAGLAIFAVGLVVGGVAGSPGQLIAGRAIMGSGAALIMPATLSTITVVFPPGERRRAIALWAAFAGAGGSFGPVVSGLLLERFWWGSTLLAQIPVVAITAVAVGILCPRSRDDAVTPLDPVGALLSLVGLTALLFAIIEGPEHGWLHTRTMGAMVGGLLVLTLFVLWERRSTYPMLPMFLFSDLRFRVGSGVVTMVFFIMFGWFFANTLYLQFVRDYSALHASLAMLPFPVAMILAAPRSAKLGELFGSGKVITAGFGVVAFGFSVTAFTTPATPYWVLGLAYAIMGSGMAITSAPATGNIMSAVPAGKAGVGSAVNDTTREFGGALGIAVTGSLMSSLYRAGVSTEGLRLGPEAAEAARESVGAATTVAGTISQGGAELAARAIDAFAGSYRIINVVSAVLALTGALGVAKFFPQHKEVEANQSPPAAMPEPAGAGSSR